MEKINKNIDPAGEIKEEELVDATSTEDSTGGVSPTVVAVTVAASAAFCPTTKCSSKC